MQRLLSLSAVIGSAIVASVTVSHAGGPPAQVPEPSAIALLGVGAAAFAWWQFGRKKK
jgi:PEP-CTERM motif